MGADGVNPSDHTASVQVVGSKVPRNRGSGGGDESRMAVNRVDDDDDEESSVYFAETDKWFLCMTCDLGGGSTPRSLSEALAETSITRGDKLDAAQAMVEV